MIRMLSCRSVCLLVVSWFSVASAQSPTAENQVPAMVGHASCAASTCHGGVVGRGPAWNHSLSTWIARDPHAGAGLLLRDADSRLIVTRLDPHAADSQANYDAVLRQRCISCHATVSAAQTTVADPAGSASLLDDSLLAAGVSCEACHGPAEKWLTAHLTSEFAGPQRFEPEIGMRDTESLVGRAETCVRCHVGSRTADGLVRDMNHDLIAAGHPAVRFDLQIYDANLPVHWNPDTAIEQEFHSSVLRVRRVGRAVSLAAAASLSSERAEDHRRDPRTVPWPELSDYDCFACHQSLSIDHYEVARTADDQPLVSSGLPLWNAWYTLGELELRDNSDLLKRLSPQGSDPQLIANSGQSLGKRYRQLASERSGQSPDAKAAIRTVLEKLRSTPPQDWHDAAIIYLELDAALRDLASDASTRQQGQRWLAALDNVERRLRFQPPSSTADGDTSAPTGQPVPRYHSPRRYQPESFQQAVLNVFSSGPTATAPATADTQPISNLPNN